MSYLQAVSHPSNPTCNFLFKVVPKFFVIKQLFCFTVTFNDLKKKKIVFGFSMAIFKTSGLALAILFAIAFILPLVCKSNDGRDNIIFDSKRGPEEHVLTDHRRTRMRPARNVRKNTSRPETFGALYFAYHRDPVQAAGYVAAVAKSASSLKQHNPSMPVAVLTNARNLSGLDATSQSVIDIFLPIQDKDIIEGHAFKKGRQWWTRTLYLNATPFDVTVQIDSDRTVCSSIASVHSSIDGFDSLHVSVGTLPSFDNGVMVYRRGQRFQTLVDIWLRILESTDKVGDDQAALAEALGEANKRIGFRSGVLPPSYQAKHAPAVGLGWAAPTAMHTLVITGDVKIAAGDKALCDLLAQNTPHMRIAVYNSSMSAGQRHKIALSKEECNSMLHGRCRTNEMHWNASLFGNVLELSDYITKSRDCTLRQLCNVI